MKIIYLPIETKSREFNSKILIACQCLNKGYQVVICANRNIPNSINNPGVILLKSASGFEKEKLEKLRKKGLKIFLLDEEGVARTNSTLEVKNRYSQETLDKLDFVLLNSTQEKKSLLNVFKIKEEKLLLTGNPRFDFYKPKLRNLFENRLKEIKEKYGRYILIPSRFGNLNPLSNKNFIEHMKELNFIENKIDLEWWQGFNEHSLKIFNSFKDLIPKLSSFFKSYSIIIRPHPSESEDSWEEIQKKHPNVFIDSSYEIGNWILGADAIIHNGCTTGFESYLMGKNVYAYMPVSSKEYDVHLPNELSKKVSSSKEIFNDVIRSTSSARKEDIKKIKLAKENLENSDVDKYAFRKIGNLLCSKNLDFKEVSLNDLRKSKFTKVISFLRYLRFLISIRLNSRNKFIVRLFGDSYSYKKLPRLNKKEILESLKRFSSQVDINLGELKIEKLDEDFFLIEKFKSNF